MVFASLDKANPCSFSNATNQRMLLFGLDCNGFADDRREESRRYSTPTPDWPRLDSYSFEWVTGGFVHKGFDVYPSRPAAPVRLLGGRGCCCRFCSC